MSDKEKSWEELLAASTMSREEAVNAATTALALLHALKQAAPPSPARPIASDLLFDLASFQTDTMKRLAELSDRQTGKLVDALKERRATARSAGGPPVRVLVSASIAPDSPVNKRFVVRNEGGSARCYPFPDVLHLERVGGAAAGRDEGVFVSAQLTDDNGIALSATAEYAQPFLVQIPPRSSCTVRLVIPWDDRLESGRYRSVVPLLAEGAPSAELIVELVVKGKAA